MKTLYEYHNQLLNATKFEFRRDILDHIEWNERLIGLTGARGVGKTTSLLQHISEDKKKMQKQLYVTIDNLSLPYSTLIELADAFHKQGGTHLFIDEIHKYPNWAQELKNMYDLFPKLHVVFSGSSILSLLKGKTDLSRRAVMYNMNCLSFREYLQIETKKPFPVFTLNDILKNHIEISDKLLKSIKPFQHFNAYLENGNFPFYLESLGTYTMKLQSIISFILESEMKLISGIDARNTMKIRRLLQLIAGSVPFTPNIKKLSEALELDRITLLTYIDLLEKTELITNLFSSGSFYGKLTKPEKILLANPNLYFSLATSEVNTGSLREAFFVQQMRARHKVELADKADFIVDGKFTFEVGGRSKGRQQITNTKNAFLVVDDTEFGYKNQIPLWLFGFLY